MHESAEALGHGARFGKLPLAVTFDPEWHYGLDDPHADRHSKPWTNAQGQAQGTCVHCGNCDIGCQVAAKNTLDLNYLAAARSAGAAIRADHIVRKLTPRSEEHTSELQSLMRNSYAVFCLKKKIIKTKQYQKNNN